MKTPKTKLLADLKKALLSDKIDAINKASTELEKFLKANPKQRDSCNDYVRKVMYSMRDKIETKTQEGTV